MGCKASKPKRSFSKFLIADAAPLVEHSCRKTCRFPNVDPTEPARSATAPTAALREPVVRRQGSEDRCSVMRTTVITHCIFQKGESTPLILRALGSRQFVADIEDELDRKVAPCKRG
jgi:hypothetical protein